MGTYFNRRPVDLLLFTGVVCSAKTMLKQWDIVLPTELIQYDMDARSLYPKYVIPALNKAKIASIDKWVEWGPSSLRESISKNLIKNFGKVET